MKKNFLFLLLVGMMCGSISVSAGIFSKVFKKKEFSSLGDLERHAKIFPEFPRMDNKDYIRPDYTRFYQSRTPNIFKRSWAKIKGWWPAKQKASWSPRMLNTILHDVTEERKKLLREGEFVSKFTPPVNAQFVIWGNLFGSYHSLVRSLRKLADMRVMDNNLVIQKPNCYFVFNGNAVNFSPFSMESLTTILLLMKKNSDRVFYVKGEHESKKYWEDHGLKQELQGKIRHTNDFVHFEHRLEAFFNTLPSALYVQKKIDSKSQFVEISSDGFIQNVHDQNGFHAFLHAPDYGKSSIFKVTSATLSTTIAPIPIDLYIKGDNGFSPLEKNKGLRRETSLSKAPVWRSFAAQNRTHRAMRKFFYDSFVVFSLNGPLLKSPIELYSRDVRTKGRFTKVAYTPFSKG
jgi:hypothetical protein